MGGSGALAEHHRRMLEEGSGIAPGVVAERGYWTAFDFKGLGEERLRRWPITRESFPVLVIPQHSTVGERIPAVLRPDHPRRRQNGQIVKYEWPRKVGLRLDCPPRSLSGLREPRRRLWMVEGVKKADALASVGEVAISSPGVDGWRAPSAVLDLDGIPFKGRVVVIGFDSDVFSNRMVSRAAVALARWLHLRGALVQIIDWRRAQLRPGGKAGVDDFLAERRRSA